MADSPQHATKRLQNEFSSFRSGSGYECYLVDNDLTHWNVKLFNKFNGSALELDLFCYSQFFDVNYILLDLQFPQDYPHSPPKVRVLYPRFQPGTGNVTLGGVVKCAIVENNNWTPVNTAWSLLPDIKSCFITGNGRLVMHRSFYTAEEAQSSTEGFYESYNTEPSGLPGKILLPPSALQKIANLKDVTYPLIFEISDVAHARVTHLGVLEFEASEGVVGLPAWCLKTLGMNIGEKVNIRLVSLPKGTYVKLRVAEPEFFTLNDNPKIILESELRKFAALTIGDVIEVDHEGNRYTVEVLETQPAPSMDIHESDILLDLEGDMSTDVIDKLQKEATDQVLTEDKSSSTDKNILEESSKPEEPSEDIDGTECTNCGKIVPKASYQRHTIFCERNNVVCDKCGKVVNKAKLKEHNEEYHVEVPCGKCGKKIEKYKLEYHTKRECRKKLVRCKYCKVTKPLCEMKAHLNYCGSRTEECQICKKRIMLRDMTKHTASCTVASTNPPNEPRQGWFVSMIKKTFMGERTT